MRMVDKKGRVLYKIWGNLRFGTAARGDGRRCMVVELVRVDAVNLHDVKVTVGGEAMEDSVEELQGSNG